IVEGDGHIRGRHGTCDSRLAFLQSLGYSGVINHHIIAEYIASIQRTAGESRLSDRSTVSILLLSGGDHSLTVLGAALIDVFHLEVILVDAVCHCNSKPVNGNVAVA